MSIGENVSAVMANSLMRRALAIPSRRKLMLVEAFGRVSMASLMIRLLPYRLWRSRLGVLVQGAQPVETLDALQNGVIDDVAWVHHAVQQVFGTGFTCLMLAISARDMLIGRGVQSSIVLGIERKPVSPKHQKLGAHAWVKVGNHCIVGQEGSSRFTPVAIYHTQ